MSDLVNADQTDLPGAILQDSCEQRRQFGGLDVRHTKQPPTFTFSKSTSLLCQRYLSLRVVLTWKVIGNAPNDTPERCPVDYAADWKTTGDQLGNGYTLEALEPAHVYFLPTFDQSLKKKACLHHTLGHTTLMCSGQQAGFLPLGPLGGLSDAGSLWAAHRSWAIQFQFPALQGRVATLAEEI